MITLRYSANIPELTGPNAIAMATLDLLTKPKLRAAAKAYFADVQTKDQKYVPMIAPTDKPATEINAEMMARYKPMLARFHYDPAKHPTYLDQLGVKWPMLEELPVKK